MVTVYKYEAPVDDLITVEMPLFANIIKVGSQNPRMITFWAIVNTEHTMYKRKFIVRGTGHPLPVEIITAKYLDSVMDGKFVWHVFDMGIE